MPRHSDARERMIQSAVLLFRERGVEGTAFADVLAHSGAPRGSIYHHFPGGKQQLAEEATRHAGDVMAATIAALLRHDDLREGLEAFAQLWTAVLEESDYRAGCPIVAAALEGDRLPTVRDSASATFVRWETIVADAIAARGVPARRARAQATLLIAAVEGAVVLARAERSTEPLRRVIDELGALLDTSA